MLKQDLKNYWNKATNMYETIFEETATATYYSFLPILHLEEATSVVEAACGTGRGLEILRSKLPESVKIRASDISESMIEITTKKNIPNVELIVSSFDSLPYPDGICNRFIVNQALHLAENPKLAIKEAFRLLTPGGLALFAPFGKPSPFNLIYFMTKCCEDVGFSLNHRSFFHLQNEEDFRNMVLEAGFDKVISHQTTVAYNITTVEQLINAADQMRVIKNAKATDPKIYEKVIELVKKRAEVFFSLGMPITHDSLISVGYKK